jgi:iron-sulfur cluster assembly accessory protein
MIQLSESAVTEILRLRAKRQNSNLFLRLGVQSEGCLGLSYSMGFDLAPQAGDQVYISNGLQMLVDPNSLTCIQDLTIDYSEDLMGGGFRFHNPNATQTCSCGNSFAVANSEGS